MEICFWIPTKDIYEKLIKNFSTIVILKDHKKEILTLNNDSLLFGKNSQLTSLFKKSFSSSFERISNYLSGFVDNDGKKSRFFIRVRYATLQYSVTESSIITNELSFKFII